MQRIGFVTLGCKLNYAETSTYERGILRAMAPVQEVEVVPANRQAEAYLVNTCSVTEHSDKKCRNLIRKLHRTSPDAAIFVTGCYAELKKPEIEAIEGVARVFRKDEKHLIVAAITDHLTSLVDTQVSSETASPEPASSSSPEIFPCDFNAVASSGAMFSAYSSGERTRSFLKVQDGCDYWCAYCTVPAARGRSRNAPISQIVAQAKEIAAAGIKEIVLTGVNTGDFGKSTNETFFDLIRALNDVEGIERYRISSIEPNLLTHEIVDWIASGTKFLPHFHIPLQSGSDAVLKEMGRRYTTSDFAAKIAYIRTAMESRQGAVALNGQGLVDIENTVAPLNEKGPVDPLKVFFGIDVIVGFPGETDELFESTYEFLRDVVRPAFIHVFPYSKRAGTRAAARKDQVQDSVKTQRVERLEALSEQLHAEFIAANRGCRAHVLFESTCRNGMMEGYTENYIRLERPFDPELVGEIVEIKI